jgi:hypothetical protein
MGLPGSSREFIGAKAMITLQRLFEKCLGKRCKVSSFDQRRILRNIGVRLDADVALEDAMGPGFLFGIVADAEPR